MREWECGACFTGGRVEDRSRDLWRCAFAWWPAGHAARPPCVFRGRERSAVVGRLGAQPEEQALLIHVTQALTGSRDEANPHHTTSSCPLPALLPQDYAPPRAQGHSAPEQGSPGCNGPQRVSAWFFMTCCANSARRWKTSRLHSECQATNTRRPLRANCSESLRAFKPPQSCSLCAVAGRFAAADISSDRCFFCLFA